MRPGCPPANGWAGSCSWPSPALPPATAGRLLLQGRIRGAQTQREDLAALPAPAQSERPRRRSLESPDLHLLCGERWQFFGTLTFKQERLPERVRQTMFHAALRQLAPRRCISISPACPGAGVRNSATFWGGGIITFC